MDSLPKPKQSLYEDLSIPDRKEAFKKLALFCSHLHWNPNLSGDELAQAALFPNGEAMRISLENWGLSALLPPQKEKGPKVAHKPKDKAQRTPQPGTGEGKELPSILNAEDQIRDAINTFFTYLESMTYRQEVLQGKRIVGVDEIPKEAEMFPLFRVREDYPADEWEKICAEHGKNPDSTDVFCEYTDVTFARGASYFPDWPVVCLITAVLMNAGESFRSGYPSEVERLLEKLHLDPAKAPRKQIQQLLLGRSDKGDGLYPIARKLARAIRCGEVKAKDKEGGVPKIP